MNGITQIVILSYIYEHIQELPWDYALYIEGNPPWVETTRCAVLDPDDVGDYEETPQFAVANLLRYALSIADIQDIYDNARIQLGTVSIETFIQALNYYFLNDAFIIFTSNDFQ
ncbi:hypothetical protein SD80_012285 [Scytonema tolypothrichoides VB-61278]|nr:hypothetical protein SD80_012285 [Scytonema tolypothrichoides VB-61278]